MATTGEFYMPDDELLKQLGRVAIRHGHLDYVMRLAIKRLLGISTDDPGYATETRGMSRELRKTLRTHAAAKLEGELLELLESLIVHAEAVTTLRNRVIHAVWMRVPGQEPRLYDKDRNYPLPTAVQLAHIEQRIDTVLKIINALTRGDLKWVR
jgi:hypothetical protein